jgi:hypothetical protein
MSATNNETFKFICKEESFQLAIDQVTTRSWRWTLSDETNTYEGKGGQTRDKTFIKVYSIMEKNYEDLKAKRLIRNVQLKRLLGINE